MKTKCVISLFLCVINFTTIAQGTDPVALKITGNVTPSQEELMSNVFLYLNQFWADQGKSLSRQTTEKYWVDESLRGQNYGTALMAAAEKLAIQEKCQLITVNTMDFEALEFYQKLVFFIEFERYGFHKGSIFYFLRKNLSHEGD